MRVSIKVPERFLQESTAELKIDSKTKRVWAVQLDLLSVIDRICRNHGIRYSIDSGTLIGAVRHGGMIPWDDDIDVVMPRNDYEKFCLIAPAELDGIYFLQTKESDENYDRCFARIRNVTTTAAPVSEMVNGMLFIRYNQGIFVDIFPMDNVPDDECERKDFFAKIILQRRRLVCLSRARSIYLARKHFPRSLKVLGQIFVGFWVQFLKRFLGIDIVESLLARYDCLCKSYSNATTRMVSPIAHRPYEVLGLSEFDDLADYKFEFLKVRGFRDYDRILTGQYGNWRKHVIQVRDSMFFDVERPYAEYMVDTK